MPSRDDGLKQFKSPTLGSSDGDPVVEADQAVEDDPLADLYPTFDSGDTTTGIRERNGNSASWANDEVLSNVGDLSDREVFDRWISMMSDEERNQFRVVWTAMSPEERQRYLDDMRGTSSATASGND